LFLAVSAVAGLSIGYILLFFGTWFIVTGFYYRLPDLSAIAVIVVAFAAGIAEKGFPGLAPLPMPWLVVPSPSDIPGALWSMVVPQALLTLTNAILATSLLTSDLFKTEVRPARLSRTIGLMNLASVPFGGFPMGHGAGGMAGQYRFGARTGGANVYAGLILLLLAFLFASPAMLGLVSGGFFAALLVFAAIEMAKLRVEDGFISGDRDDSDPLPRREHDDCFCCGNLCCVCTEGHQAAPGDGENAYLMLSP